MTLTDAILRRADERSSAADTDAEAAWTRLREMADAPLTTNDPYIACAVESVAAELRAARLRARLVEVASDA